MSSSISKTVAAAATTVVMAGLAAADAPTYGPPVPAASAPSQVASSHAKRAPTVTHGGRTRLFAHRWDVPAEIVELDPRTFTVLRHLPAPHGNAVGDVGLAFDGRSLFFIDGLPGGSTGVLFELDPDTGAVLDSDPIAVGLGPFDGLACLGGLVWILDGGGHDLLGFDPVTDTMAGFIDVDGVNPGLLAGGGLAAIRHPLAFVVTDYAGTVYQLDPVSGLASPIAATGVFQAAVGTVDGLIYLGEHVAGSGAEQSVATRLGAPLRNVPSLHSFSAFGGDDAYLAPLYAFPRNANDQIAELDPVTGAELRRFPAPEPNDQALGGDVGLAFDGRSLWFVSGAAGGGSGLLFELDPADGSVRNIHPPPLPPPSIDGLAALGGLLFVSDNIADDIVVYDPQLGVVVNLLDIDVINPGTDLIGGLAGIHWPSAIIATGPAVAYEIDPVTGVVTNSIPVPIPLAGGVAVVDGLLYFGDLMPATGMDLRVITRQGQPLRSFTAPYGFSGLAGDDTTFELSWTIFRDGFESGDTSAWSATVP